MQFCYEELSSYPPLEALKGRLYVQHGWGDGNTVSDASSRGYDDVLAALCRNMRVRHEHVDVPPEAIDFLRRLRERNRAIVLARAAEVSERNSEMDISPDPDVDDPFGDGVRIGEAAVPGPRFSRPTQEGGQRGSAEGERDVSDTQTSQHITCPTFVDRGGLGMVGASVT